MLPVRILGDVETRRSYDSYLKWSQFEGINPDNALSRSEYQTAVNLLTYKTIQELHDGFHRAIANLSLPSESEIVLYSPIASRRDIKERIADDAGPSEIPVILKDFSAEDLTSAAKVSETVTNAMFKYRTQTGISTAEVSPENLVPLSKENWRKTCKYGKTRNSSRIILLADYSSSGQQATEFLESVFENFDIKRAVAEKRTTINLYVFCITRQALKRILEYKGKIENDIKTTAFYINYEYACVSLKKTCLPVNKNSRLYRGTKYGITGGNKLKSGLSLFASQWTIPNNLPTIFVGRKKNSESEYRDYDSLLLFGKRSNRLGARDAFESRESRLSSRAVRRLLVDSREVEDRNIKEYFSRDSVSVLYDILGFCYTIRSSFDIMEVTGLGYQEVKSCMHKLETEELVRRVQSNKYGKSFGWRISKLGYARLCREARLETSECSGLTSGGADLTSHSDQHIIKVLLKGS